MFPANIWRLSTPPFYLPLIQLQTSNLGRSVPSEACLWWWLGYFLSVHIDRDIWWPSTPLLSYPPSYKYIPLIWVEVFPAIQTGQLHKSYEACLQQCFGDFLSAHKQRYLKTVNSLPSYRPFLPSYRPCLPIQSHTSNFGRSVPSDSNRGSNTNLMKPVCDDGLVTFSLSINGEIGRPSNFSMSLCWKKSKNYSLAHQAHQGFFVWVSQKEVHFSKFICIYKW